MKAIGESGITRRVGSKSHPAGEAVRNKRKKTLEAVLGKGKRCHHAYFAIMHALDECDIRGTEGRTPDFAIKKSAGRNPR